MSKYLSALAVLFFLFAPVLTGPALAQVDVNTTYGIDAVDNAIANNLGDSNTDPRAVIGRVINIALSFLGVIAVVIILLGGFKWMTAGGNEEKTSEARKLLAAGVIGLIIILASWAIATFVIGQLSNAVNGTTA